MLPPRGVWVWLVVLPAALGAATPVPPVSGEVSGELVPRLLPGAPNVAWKLALRPGNAAGGRAADLALDGPGVRAAGTAQLAANGEGTWRIERGELDAAVWFGALAGRFFPALRSTAAEGAIALSGEGAWRAGGWSGRLALALRDGLVRGAGQGWTLRGVELRGTLGALPSLATDGAVTLTFAEATVANITARNGRIELAVDAEEKVTVRRATCEVLEGSIDVMPFSFPLSAPVARTDVRVDRIELAQLAPLLPPVLSTASGKISGRVALAWDAAAGVQPGNGRLQVDPGSTVAIRLAPQPGFFTGRIPRTIAVLPGPFAKLINLPNPAYEPLRAIEMGETVLEVSALDIGLSPEGDADGRTARLVFTARPEKRDDVEFVKFEVNVKGPLADVLRLGIEHGISVHTR